MYAVAVAAAVTVIGALVRARWQPMLDADEAAIRAMTDFTRDRPALRTALVAWQEITQPWRPYLVASLLCLWMWLKKGYTTRAWWAFVTMMLAWNIALVAKYVVQRARPVVEDAVSHAPGYSFPSGHAANAAAVAAAVVILLWPVLKPVAKRVAVVLGVAYTVVTALDRPMLGVHYPSDVVAGVILGCGLVAASFAGYRGWRPGDTHDPTRQHRPGDIEIPDDDGVPDPTPRTPGVAAATRDDRRR